MQIFRQDFAFARFSFVKCVIYHLQHKSRLKRTKTRLHGHGCGCARLCPSLKGESESTPCRKAEPNVTYIRVRAFYYILQKVTACSTRARFAISNEDTFAPASPRARGTRTAPRPPHARALSRGYVNPNYKNVLIFCKIHCFCFGFVTFLAIFFFFFFYVRIYVYIYAYIRM